VFLVIGSAIMVLDSFVMGLSDQFMPDFAIFIILPSLFCAYYWSQDKLNVNSDTFVGTKVRLSLTYALIAASIFVGLFLFVSVSTTYSNPTLFHYLDESLTFFRVIFRGI